MIDRNSSDTQDELKHRSAMRQLLDGAAKEFGFAVSDIRNELVDRAWFDRDSSVMREASAGLDDRESAGLGERDYSRDDVYGRDPFEDRGHEIERSEMDR